MANKLIVPQTMVIIFIALAAMSTGTAAREVSSNENPTEITKVGVIKRYVNVTNELGANVMLKIHCRSKEDDLGEHELAFGGSYFWNFKSNLFVHSTLYYCSMSWDSVFGTFDVYRATRDDSRCATKCWWRIRTDGAFSYDEGLDRWDLLYEWNTLG